MTTFDGSGAVIVWGRVLRVLTSWGGQSSASRCPMDLYTRWRCPRSDRRQALWLLTQTGMWKRPQQLSDEQVRVNVTSVTWKEAKEELFQPSCVGDSASESNGTEEEELRSAVLDGMWRCKGLMCTGLHCHSALTKPILNVFCDHLFNISLQQVIGNPKMPCWVIQSETDPFTLDNVTTF